jgi:glyoxylase-like metal-dependent hydrolase (beta-lactamase superfamily II)
LKQSLNNTALLIGDGETLMVDAAMDVRRTSYMIKQWEELRPEAARIDHLAVTHWHVDHTVGLAAPELKAANVIASEPCANYMAKNPPATWMAQINALTGVARKSSEENLGIKFDLSVLE